MLPQVKGDKLYSSACRSLRRRQQQHRIRRWKLSYKRPESRSDNLGPFTKTLFS